MRRSTVLSLPLRLVFPDHLHQLKIYRGEAGYEVFSHFFLNLWRLDHLIFIKQHQTINIKQQQHLKIFQLISN
jgi:hypothetical protein